MNKLEPVGYVEGRPYSVQRDPKGTLYIKDEADAEIARLKAELGTMRQLSYALKKECEKQHSLAAEQFDRAEKAERERDEARGGWLECFMEFSGYVGELVNCYGPVANDSHKARAFDTIIRRIAEMRGPEGPPGWDDDEPAPSPDQELETLTIPTLPTNPEADRIADQLFREAKPGNDREILGEEPDQEETE